MEKKDLYKLLAVGFVLIFGIEMIAIGFFNNSNSSGGNSQLPATSNSIQGTVADNITIVRYEPYLIVNGGAGVDAVAQKLIDDGAATYSVVNQGSLIVNLKSSDEVISSASAFEDANATVLASAVISTSPSITISGDGLTTKADGTSFRMQIRPIYPQGSSVPATFAAAASNGQLISVGSFTLLPPQIYGAQATAKVLSLSGSSTIIEVPWEQRAAAKAIAKSAGAAYREKSFILISLNATAQQMSSIRAFPYVTGVQYGVASVQNNFTNRLLAQQQIFSVGVDSQFPPSEASFENQTSNATASQLLAALESSGIATKTVSSTSLVFKLPPYIEKDGKKYETGEIELSAQSTAIPSDVAEVELEVDFEAAGGKMGKILAVRLANEPSS
jgi:hypothetical protein